MHRWLRSAVALYSVPRLSATLAYMLQNTEYQLLPYLRWFWRTQDFSRVMHRRTLEYTRAARLIRLIVGLGVLGHVAFALLYMGTARISHSPGAFWYGAAALVAYPVVWAHILAIGVLVGRLLVGVPRERKNAQQAAELFQAHPGLRIAIAGSYGKTSMKELLATVLQEGKRVAATPGNMNVISSHARFARSLSGEEEVVIVEFGEGRPGDVALFSRVVQPTHAVITGVAPAHLDQYKTLEAAANDIFSLASFVSSEQLYVNADSDAVHSFLQPEFRIYSRSTTLGWRIQKQTTNLEGTSFELVKGKKCLKLKSGLVGLHMVGPLAFVAAFALQLGLSEKQVVRGIAKTKPFEHRMQPYSLGGATIIDDTYNGNLEGVRAGTELLKLLPAKRKIYVTPGLVDQGKDSPSIHRALGRTIAMAEPDVVVLMKNSVTQYIAAGLSDTDFAGEVRIETDPLSFYQNLSSFTAKGDLVLMQNDWPDNYA